MNEKDALLLNRRRVLSLWSNLFEEGKLIQVGRALEAELGVASERPTLT